MIRIGKTPPPSGVTLSAGAGKKPPLWKVQIVKPFTSIAESQRSDPKRPWLVTHFKITNMRGETEEIPSTETILKLINAETGATIEVPAFAAHHIISLHLTGEEAGSLINASSLEESFGIVAEHLPGIIPYKGESAAFEIDTGKPTGTEGVTTRREMLVKRIITQADIDILDSAKEKVFSLNLQGADEEKAAFVEQFNARMQGRRVKLGIRGGTIAPFYSIERQATTKLFFVVGREKDPDGSAHERVWTLTTGRYMDKLPTDSSFIGRIPTAGVPEGTIVAQLIERQKKGEVLNLAERALIDAQTRAQACWWEGGFIDPPKQS